MAPAPVIWFVTGSSRGLGQAIVEYALGSGDNVVATARNPNDLQHFIDRFGSDRVLALALDVTDYKAAQDAAHKAVETFGHVDIVVNNAGYGDFVSAEDSDLDDFKRVIDVTFYGTVNVTKAFLPTLRKQGAGHIFQIASIGSRVGTPGLSAYQSAKWAVAGFSTSLNTEVSGLGIKVTVLEPGAMPTDFANPSSMTFHDISEPYKPTLDVMLGHIRRAEKGKVTPLEKVGRVIAKLYREPNPPLRLVLGEDALNYAGMAAKALSDSDERWKELSIAEA